jgi:hypothetical protein
MGFGPVQRRIFPECKDPSDCCQVMVRGEQRTIDVYNVAIVRELGKLEDGITLRWTSYHM